MGFKQFDSSGGGGGGGGAGTVTNTGTLTASQLIIGNGGVDVKALGTLGTSTTVLHGNAAGDPTFAAISLTADISGTLPAANGGTGIASYAVGDVLYASAATTLSKLAAVAVGQVIISNGVTTAPSWSGTPRLSGINDVNGNSEILFTATASAVYGLTLANAALLGTVAIGVTAPTQVTASVAGTPISITAQAAVAGSGTNGAAAGGAVTITSGAAARLVSGVANGGNINLVTGAGIGGGTAGVVIIPDGALTAPGIAFSSAQTTGFAISGSIRVIMAAVTTFSFSTTGIFMNQDAASIITFGNANDLFLRRATAASLQQGAADVNGAAVAQTTRVQSAITGTDQNGANWTFVGSRQTGAGTPGDIIFQTSAKLASGTTQGTPAAGLTVTGSILNMKPSVLVGNAALATTDTEGFLYIPTCAGTPSGVPTARTGLIPMIYDTTADVFWFYRAGWKQPKTPAGAALVTWQ